MSTMRTIAAVLIIASTARLVTDQFHPAFEAMFFVGCFLVILDGVLSFWRRRNSPGTSSS